MSQKIPLRGKQGQGKFAIIDNADFGIVSPHTWRGVLSGNTLYAVSTIFTDGKWRTVRMHRLILGPAPSQLVDHKNGNGIDNRRKNMRLATRTQNRRNSLQKSDSTTKYKGVRKSASGYQWQASITVDGKRIALGGYRTQWDAAQAYNAAALKYFKEFSRLNELPDCPDPDDLPLQTPPQSSRYIGVVYDKSRDKWLAQGPKIHGKSKRLGRYATQEEAARARDAYCIERGLDAPLNF